VTADRDSDQLSFIDAGTLKVKGAAKVGKRPFGVTIDDKTNRAFTANVGSNSVSVVDIASGTVLAEVKTGERPYAVALASGKAFVTNQYEGTLTVFDVATYKPTRGIDVAEYPEGIAASGDGKFIYVANWFDNTLMKIDAILNRVIGKVQTGNGPRAFGAFIRPKR
jgi:YVTN family beta-propeller protein